MRWMKYALLAPALMLLGTLLSSKAAGPESPWRESGWTGAFAMPRPTVPGQPATLDVAGPITTGMRLRIYRVDEPGAFMDRLLAKSQSEPFMTGNRAGQDPLDILREAFLWGGRRAFVTVHRTASRAFRDLARSTNGLQSPKLGAVAPREGEAVPLDHQPGITFISELNPQVTEERTEVKHTKGESSWYSQAAGHLSHVALPAQNAGVYLLEMLRGSEAAYVPWLVTDLALIGDQDGVKLRIQAVSARDGSTRSDVAGKIFEGTQGRSLAFGHDGRAESAAGPGVRRVVLAQSGQSMALLAIEGQGGAQVRQRIYAYTDRPLYRPGQEVFVKAALRSVRDGQNEVSKGVKDLPFTVLDPEDTKVAEGKATLVSADTGTFAASVILPGAGRLGLYRWVFQGPEGPGQAEFKVEKFLKPAYSVEVTSPTEKVGTGDEMSFDIKARYFYGAAVRKAKADWFLYKVVPQRNQGWYGSDEGPAPELLESGELNLNEEGEAQSQAFRATEAVLYRFVVKVTDGSGQQNSGSAQVRAAAADRVLLVSTDRSVVQPGKPFKVSARVLDLEGRELAGIPISLRAADVVVEHYPGAWWANPSALVPEQTVAKAQGPRGEMTIPQAGFYLVVAEAQDSLGRKISAQCLLTVATEGSPLPAVPDLRATADKGQYKPGEVARILVQLPQPRLTLHWTVESETLGPRESRTVAGTTTLVEVPISAAMQPNAWVVFETVADGHRQLAEVPLRAPRTDRRLQVEVRTDQDSYRPGQTMKVAVQVRDDQGRPAPADLSVGVVDEAIYALSAELHPDIVRFFNPSRRHSVNHTGSTEWSFWDILRRQRPVWSLRQTRRGEFKSDDADKIRQNFKDTAQWVPFLAAGRDGKATTELVLPDNLTSWRATATAITSDTKAGVGRTQRPAAKPLQVSLTLPRTLSLGEEARAIAQVRNLSGQPLQGRVWLEVANGRLDSTTPAAFNLMDRGEHRLSIALRTYRTGPLTVTAHVEGGAFKDAERREVLVLDQLVPASVSGYIRLQGGSETVTIPPPPTAKGEAALVVLPVASLEQLAAPSLPYLISYPYGCVEQTLSSFLPNVLVADLIKQGKMPAMDWKKLVDLDRNIRDGVFRIYGYQQPNGGWGWYAPGDFGLDANPHTTGYAIEGFATMRRLGYPVDENVYQRGIQAAINLFRQCAQQADRRTPGSPAKQGQTADPWGDAAFLLQALAQTGSPLAGMVDSSADKVLSNKWAGSHVDAMVTLAAVLARNGKADALLNRLESVAVTQGGLSHWEGDRDHWWSYENGEIVPTVMALKALLLGRPHSPLIPQAEAFLSTRFQGSGWNSTWNTSQVVGLLPYLAKARPLEWSVGDLKAAVEGGPSWDFSHERAPTIANWNRREPRPGYLPLSAPRALKLTGTGRGVLVWTYSYQVPGSATAVQKGDTSSGGLRLLLFRQTWVLRSPQQTGIPAQGWVRALYTGTLNSGQEAWMELSVQVDREADYAVLEVPIPAGLEPIVKLEGFVLEGVPLTMAGSSTDPWNKPRIEVHPDKVSFLWQKLHPWDRQKVRILLRAAMAGSYRIRPARLSLMGNEGQWITCDGQDLWVPEEVSR